MAYWIKQEKSQKSSSHYYASYDIKKKNGLPGSCAVFVPQNNIILPFGSSREIQEQEFPTDLQENFITVAVLLATLLRASVFLKQRKKNIVQTYFRVWNHFQLFDFGQIDHSDLIVPQFQSNSVVIQWIQSVFLPPLLWFLKNCMCFPYSLPSIWCSILNNYTVGKFCCYLLLPFLCLVYLFFTFSFNVINTLFRSVQVYNKFYITDKHHYSVYFLLFWPRSSSLFTLKWWQYCW